MEKHYQKMIQDTQDRAAKSLQIQVLDKESPRYGGFADENGIVQAKFSIYRAASMTAVYCNQDSCYYHDEKILESILLGLSYVRRVQHENGLFDYITCNFYSAPDTAFCLKKLLPVYQYLRREAEKGGLPQGEGQILAAVEEIVRAGLMVFWRADFIRPTTAGPLPDRKSVV